MESYLDEKVRERSMLPRIVLLATDGSDKVSLAAEEAISITGKTGAELHLVHVWHDIPTAHFRNLVRAELKRKGQEVLDQQVERIEETGVQVAGAHLRMGHAADEISELGEEIGADLILVGSRDLGPVGRAFLGSVSAELVRRASSPVMVVGNKGRQQTPVSRQMATERSA